MAFGGGGNDVEIKILAEVQEARKQIQSVSDDVSKLGTNAKKAGEQVDGLTNIAKKLGAVLGGALSVKAIGQFIELGDAVNDVSGAFEQAAEKAGVLSGSLLQGLQQATKGGVDNLRLMAQASKALQLNIPAEQLDDLAFAAQNFAEKTNTDFASAFQTLTSAVNTGRESTLRLFGTVKDGQLVIQKFGEDQARAAEESKGLGDILATVQTRFTNYVQGLASAIDNNKTLIGLVRTLLELFDKVAGAVGKVASALLDLLDPALKFINTKIQQASFGLTVLSQVMDKIGNGEVPSLADIVGGELLKSFVESNLGASNLSETLRVKTNRALKESGSVAKKAALDFKELAEAANASVEKVLGFESAFTQNLRGQVDTALKSPGADFAEQLFAISDSTAKKIQQDFLDKVIDEDEAKARFKELGDIFDQELQKLSQKVSIPDSLPKGATVDSIFSSATDSEETQSALSQLGTDVANILGQAVASGLQNGFSRADIQPLASSLFSSVGAALGSEFGPAGTAIGSTIGNVVGNLVGSIASSFGEDSAGTKARKAADKFFADMFDANRLSVIVGGEVKQISDLVFSGETPFGGNVSAGSTGFTAVFDNMNQAAKGAFAGIGTAFEELLGLSEDLSGQLAAVFANNIGGSLTNLQLLVESTGKTFTELGDAIFQAFFNGSIGLDELVANLNGLQLAFTPGIADAVGAVEQAVHNFQTALADDRPGRALFKALRDIGVEAQELGVKDLPGLASKVAGFMGLAADRVVALMQAMKLAGINSITDLVNASNAQLAALAANVQQVTQGGQPTNTAVTDPNAGFNPGTNFTPRTPVSTGGGAGSSKNNKESERKRQEEERKRSLQQLANQVLQAFQASKQYSEITTLVENKQISQSEAMERLKDLYGDVREKVTALNSAQKDYDEAARSGAKNLADLALKVSAAKSALEDAKKNQDEGIKVAKGFFEQFKNNLNLLALATKAVGKSIGDVTGQLLEGLNAGKISFSDFRKQIADTNEAFSGGIGGKKGAVAEAFNSFLSAGKNGGAIGISRFRGVLNEAKEFFDSSLSPERQSKRTVFEAAFNNARDALEAARKSGQTGQALTDLEDRFKGAKKELDDFNNLIPNLKLGDLRSILEKFESPEVVRTFFTALEDNGITSFEDLSSASDDAIANIIGSFQDLGGPLEETSSQINDLNNQLTQLTAEKKGSITFDVTFNATQAFGQTILDAIPGGANVTIGADGNGPGLPQETPTKTPTNTPTANKVTYTRVSAGVYRGSDGNLYQKKGNKYVRLKR